MELPVDRGSEQRLAASAMPLNKEVVRDLARILGVENPQPPMVEDPVLPKVLDEGLSTRPLAVIGDQIDGKLELAMPCEFPVPVQQQSK